MIMFVCIDMDWIHMDAFWSNGIKYLSIWLCFLYAICFKSLFTKMIFLFVVIADYCLVFETNNTFGVIAFFIVQVLYYYRIHNNSMKSWWSVALVSCSILSIVLLCHIPVDLMACIAIIYFMTFVFNLCILIRTKNFSMFTLGFFLYFLCDINVGIVNGLSYGLFHNETIVAFAQIFIWIFYLPGQMLLVTKSDLV